MQQLKIELTEDERLVLEFRTFEYKGLQINFDQYMRGGREYDDAHYKRVIDTLLEKYTALQKCLVEVIKNHGHKGITVMNYDFKVNENTLTMMI